MLRVQKRKKHDGRKKTVILILTLALVLAGGGTAAFLLTRTETTPVPVRENTGGVLQAREKGEIAHMTIRVRGREPWSASRDAEGNLTLDDGGDWTLDPTLGERVEDALANLVYEDILTEDRSEYADQLADFGLADPALTATVQYTDGTEITFHVGDASGLEDADYRFLILEGDDRLYAVAGSLMEDLAFEKELLHPVTQPEIQTSRLDRVSVLDGDGRLRYEWTLRGAITDADAPANWILNAPIQYPADQDQMSNLRKNAGNLRLGLYVGEDNAENRALYGLDAPTGMIELHLGAGSTGQVTEEGAYNVTDRPEQTLRFTIGASRNEMTDYVLYEDVIYTMNHFTIETLTGVDPMSTLARYPVTTPLTSLQRLVIEKADGQRDEYVLTYEAATEEEKENQEGTRVSCTRNGENYSYETFSAAYERWMVVTVSGRLPEGWEKKETETRVTFHTLNGQTHILELSPFDALHDAVTVDGWTLFYLIRGGLESAF